MREREASRAPVCVWVCVCVSACLGVRVGECVGVVMLPGGEADDGG